MSTRNDTVLRRVQLETNCNAKLTFISAALAAAAVSEITAVAAASTVSIPGPFEAFASAKPFLQATGSQRQRGTAGD